RSTRSGEREGRDVDTAARHLLQRTRPGARQEPEVLRRVPEPRQSRHPAGRDPGRLGLTHGADGRRAARPGHRGAQHPGPRRGGRFFGREGPTEAIWAVVPVLVFAIVFGLSMDYEVFLLTRVKEVFDKTGRNDHATMEGLSATASTITSAALIMILVFGTFAFTRVLAVQLIGFGLAAAVLLDATLIRMVLVPAIMHIAGRW